MRIWAFSVRRWQFTLVLFGLLIAVGVNCSAPADVAHAAAVASEVSGKPVVVYPNSGETWDAAARAWTGGRSACRSSTTSSRARAPRGWRSSRAA